MEILIKLLETNYSSQVLSIVILFFLLVNLLKFARLFIVFLFKKYHQEIKAILHDYPIFQKDVKEKIDYICKDINSLKKQIEDVEKENKIANEKNEEKIYDILKNK